MPNETPEDPLLALRQYQQLAPWNLRDLASVAGALLEASGVRPTNAAARTRPSDRTIRYYVAQGLMAPPEGRGTSATYSYRHLLQILLIKLRQMEGVPLSRIGTELEEHTGDIVERRVASALGSGVIPPSRLSIANPQAARGRAGRAIHAWARGEASDQPAESGKGLASTKWHRVPVISGLELHVNDGHPLAKYIGEGSDIADAVRLAVNRLLMRDE